MSGFSHVLTQHEIDLTRSCATSTYVIFISIYNYRYYKSNKIFSNNWVKSYYYYFQMNMLLRGFGDNLVTFYYGLHYYFFTIFRVMSINSLYKYCEVIKRIFLRLILSLVISLLSFYLCIVHFMTVKLDNGQEKLIKK